MQTMGERERGGRTRERERERCNCCRRSPRPEPTVLRVPLLANSGVAEMGALNHKHSLKAVDWGEEEAGRLELLVSLLTSSDCREPSEGAGSRKATGGQTADSRPEEAGIKVKTLLLT